MRVLLDTNVVLDSLLARAPWHVDADEILRRSQPGVLDLAVSALTVANLFYIGRKLVGAAQARLDVQRCLAAFEILPLDKQALTDADSLPGNDFEDNLQMASAALAKLDLIVTRNLADFAGSPVRVVTPPQLLALLTP
ncbi:MAG TPA: PIN domain-containing protein [Pirellulales bacterium]|nr:PIN domain-containing protein [Pirellulales bacterium]